MKTYVVLIACIQALHSPLEDTCILEPLDITFKNVPECLAYVDNFAYTLRNNKDLFITGFCTNKNDTI
tara:strand:+ start:446 stop:649 length:204 start_codon:yes stop_codon:yes gene_type:complete